MNVTRVERTDGVNIPPPYTFTLNGENNNIFIYVENTTYFQQQQPIGLGYGGFRRMSYLQLKSTLLAPDNEYFRLKWDGDRLTIYQGLPSGEYTLAAIWNNYPTMMVPTIPRWENPHLA